MNENFASFIEKVSPLSGVVAVLLLTYGLILIRPTDYFPSPERAVEIFTQNPTQLQRGALIGGFYSVVFLLWFTSDVFKSLVQNNGSNSFAPALALTGGVILAVGLMLSNGIFWVVAGRVIRAGGIDTESAVIFYDLIQIFLSNILTIGLALFIGATGFGSLQTNLLPVWLGWTSLVFAIGLLTPYHYIFEGLALIWILIASITLYR